MWKVAVLVFLVGCGDNDRSPPPRSVAPSPTEGVDDPGLAALLVTQWDLEAAVDPLTATYYGDHRVDAVLPPVSPAEFAALATRRHALLAAVTAFDPSQLDDRDRVTYGVLRERVTVAAGLEVCDYQRWAVSGRVGLFLRLDALGSYHPLLGPDDAASYLARVQAMAAAIDAFGAELAAGAAAGETNRQQAVADAFGTLEAWAARPVAGWPLVQSIYDGYLDDDARDQLVTQVSAVITGELAPAYLRLASTIQRAVLPNARAVEGLAGLPAGTACYAAEIRRHTSELVSAAELHALGEAEVARIEAEMLALGQALYGVGSLDALHARLAGDPAQHFTSERDIVDWATMIIERAKDRTAPLFASLPSTPLVITPYSADAGQIAAAYQQSADGVAPARFFLVTQPFGSQTRWDLEATTYHESIPGHHLQVGRAVLLTDQPAIRRLFDDTAFIEGWGLYAETLADEIGLYTNDAARIGRLSNEALRACRLVIDTGLHDLGWTRAQAEAYLAAHTLYRGDFITTEIERYINGPGQALAYKVGERELLRVRAELEARAGTAFSLRDFHEAVLAVGSMPLPVLAARLLGPVGVGQTRRAPQPPDATSRLLARRPPPPALDSGFRTP